MTKKQKITLTDPDPLRSSLGMTPETAQKIVEEAKSYERLGMIQEARGTYEQLRAGDPFYEWAQAQLIGMDSYGPDAPKAAARGLKLLQESSTDYYVWIETCQALHYSGRSREAFNLYNNHRERAKQSGPEAYNLACYASKCGEWGRAAEALQFAADQRAEDANKMIMDIDLQPLWEHLQSDQLTDDEAISWAWPGWPRLWEQILSQREEIGVEFDMIERLPKPFQSWMKKNVVKGKYFMNPASSLQLRQDYLRWQYQYKTSLVELLTTIHEQAREHLLARQLDWAEIRAKEGIFLPARYHLEWYLKSCPEKWDEVDRRFRPLGLGYFLDDIRSGLQVEPRMLEILKPDGRRGDSAHAPEDREFWDGQPPQVTKSTVALIQRAQQIECDPEEMKALPLWIEVMRRWPQDTCGFHNAMRLCVRQGQWDKARQILAFLPPGSRAIFPTLEVCEQIQREDADYTLGKKWGTFYGQPCLGNRLSVESKTL